ncbi:MAG: FKBP-type peptidyl-prolyl cis-trans isomerase [Candidatus Helarchaeota archaeon]
MTSEKRKKGKKDKEEKKDEDIEEESKEEAGIELEKGDFVYLDLIGRIKKTNDVIITTIKEIAEESEIYDGNDGIYVPQLVIVGENFTIQGLSITGVSEKLVGMKVGETQAFTVPPKDAFGERSVKNIKDYTMKKIKTVEKNPRPGKRITIDNKTGVIVRVDTRGRVKVDFNHPYAGLEILYEITIKEVIKDESEKLNALINSRIPLQDPSKLQVEREDKILSITMDGNIAFQLMRHLPMIKLGLTLDIQRYFDIETIRFIEVYSKQLFGVGGESTMEGHEHHEGHEHGEGHDHSESHEDHEHGEDSK